MVRQGLTGSNTQTTPTEVPKPVKPPGETPVAGRPPPRAHTKEARQLDTYGVPIKRDRAGHQRLIHRAVDKYTPKATHRPRPALGAKLRPKLETSPNHIN